MAANHKKGVIDYEEKIRNFDKNRYSCKSRKSEVDEVIKEAIKQ